VTFVWVTRVRNGTRFSEISSAITQAPGSPPVLLSGCILYAPVDLGALGSGRARGGVVLGRRPVVLVEVTA
jgi:hypothetical protein